MNELNEQIAGTCFGGLPAPGGSILDLDFIVSSTDLSAEEYGDSPLPFLRSLGIDVSGWNPASAVKVLRSTVMSPYLTTDYVAANYVDQFLDAIVTHLAALD